MGKITKNIIFWNFWFYIYILTLYIFFRNAAKKDMQIYCKKIVKNIVYILYMCFKQMLTEGTS